MWGRKSNKDGQSVSDEARNALRQSINDWYAVQDLKPEVEATVRGHLKLQLDNHFAERIWLAYRGDE